MNGWIQNVFQKFRRYYLLQKKKFKDNIKKLKIPRFLFQSKSEKPFDF